MYAKWLVHACAERRGRGLSVFLVGLAALIVSVAFVATAGAAAPEGPNETFAVSTNAAGEPAAGSGAVEYGPVSISEDGRFVAFESAADNLGEAGPVGATEGYVKDLETGQVTLATRADGLDGEPAGAPGITNFVLSEDGRYVMFTSAATNLGTELPGEEDGETHVYRRDLRTGTTTLVDRVSHEGQIFSRSATGTSISADGRFVTFFANVANLEDPAGDHTPTANQVGYIADLQNHTTTAVTRADGADGVLADGEQMNGLAVSPDGRFVTFSSDASNLVPGVTEGVWAQVYLRELASDTNSLLSKNAAGEPGLRSSFFPTFSGGEGCFVEFGSIASNLLEPDPTVVSGEQVYVVDRCAAPQTIELVSKDATNPIADYAGGGWLAPAVSADGGQALFVGTLGGSRNAHLFVRDREHAGTVTGDRASGEAGAAGNAEPQLFAISANGCRVVFATAATNLGTTVPAGSTQVYVRQLERCAPAPQDVNVRIEGREETLFEGIVPVSIHKIRASSDLEERACDGINALDPQNTEPGVTPTLASVEAMESIGETFDGEWYDGYGDYFLTRWGPDAQDPSTGAYWGILVNEVYTNVGGCQYQLDGDDQVLWVYDAFSGRPSLGLFPEAAHYEKGPRPTEATATVGVPFPVEVVAYEDDTQDIPGEEPSRQGSQGYAGAEVAPVTTDAKGFQRVETASPEAVVTDSEGKTSVVFTTPGIHRIKATVGTPGHESVVRSNAIEVDVLPAETGPPGPEDGNTGDDGGSENPGTAGDTGKDTTRSSAPSPSTTPKPAPARVSRPQLVRGALDEGRLRLRWKVLSGGASIKRWRIETRTLGRKGAHFRTRASGHKGSAATIHLPAGGRYRIRFSLLDRSGHTTRYVLGTVRVPS